ncbi:MAG: NAD(P)/FAD-dependent oxidoreductase [Bacteroidota bacterium]
MRVNIIGAGVSGLSVGCYLQMNGFETHIYEKNATSGGLCTSWKRGEYTFDGCIHWLLGSNHSNPFYKLWSELIDMDSIDFVNHKVRAEIEVKNSVDSNGNKIFHLYTNLNKLEQYMFDIAPEDSRVIRKFIRAIRKIQQYEVPPIVDKVPRLLTFREKIRMIEHLPLLMFIMKWKKVTNFSFADEFKNPFLKESFQLLYDGDDINLLILMIPLASYDKNGAGYPIGGSYQFAQKIEQKYIALGGEIRFGKSVEKIICKNDNAIGLQLNDGSMIESDITISAADWQYTLFKALDGRYTNQLIHKLNEQKELKVYYSIFMVALGVSRKFEDFPHFFRFPLKVDLVSPDGTSYSRLEVHIYNYDPTLAPEGKTVLSVSFYTTQGDFWINLRSSDKAKYDGIKNVFAQEIINALEQKLENIKAFIEEVDIITPATYQRYTANRAGSVQGWLPNKNLTARSPIDIDLPGLNNFYYTGHWVMPGGGLPVAIKTGRDLTQIICRRNNIKFKIC